jgi:hypothetical protein
LEDGGGGMSSCAKRLDKNKRELKTTTKLNPFIFIKNNWIN